MKRPTRIVMLLLMLTGCGQRYPADRVTTVDSEDPAMNAAMDKARATVPTFIAALENPKPGQSGFTIKKPFKDGEKFEHMWIDRVGYDGTKFRGSVANEPESVTNVIMGRRVTVAPDEISDWMFIDNGKLAGGYTLRVLRETLSPSEKAKFDKSLPFTID